MKVVVHNNISECYNVTRIGTAGLFIGNNFKITDKDGQFEIRNCQASPADFRLSRQSARFDELLRTTDKDAH